MSKPDYAFRTATHTWHAVPGDGRYRATPGGAELHLTPDAQTVPAALLDAALERVVAAWVIARGGRSLNLNGQRRALHPQELERPPTGPVRRLVSIAPSNAEIVGALGATGLLVGAESSSDYPPEVLQLPRLGPDLHVDVPALAALEPDLVLASLTVPGMERNIAALDAHGLPMLVTAPQTLADIRADVLRVGAAIGHAAAAQGVVQRMDAELARLRAEAAAHRPVRVFLEWWHQPMISPGRRCWSNELIEAAGGVNVFHDLPGQSGEVAPEQVVAADPEVIFLSWCGVPYDRLNPARVLRRADLEAVAAVRTGRVFPLDEALLGRPGPRVVDGIARMAEHLRAVEPGPGTA